MSFVIIWNYPTIFRDFKFISKKQAKIKKTTEDYKSPDWSKFSCSLMKDTSCHGLNQTHSTKYWLGCWMGPLHLKQTA